MPLYSFTGTTSLSQEKTKCYQTNSLATFNDWSNKGKEAEEGGCSGTAIAGSCQGDGFGHKTCEFNVAGGAVGLTKAES